MKAIKPLLIVGILSLTACSPYYYPSSYGYGSGTGYNNGYCKPNPTPNTGGGVVTPTPGVPTSYVVQPGDTIYSISHRSGIPQQTIMSKNNITHPNQLAVGRTLIL
ncbi:MAG: hypothetical protein CR974_02765 [Gammaproteobacteria bacterium]|nr:MAG: hypothetical protein CR974_02765 [Gammaproteobacteria bacterium]